MTITVEATFENGVLRPLQPLPFAEHEKVTITIQPTSRSVEPGYGLIDWKGDPETVRWAALDKDLEYDQGDDE